MRKSNQLIRCKRASDILGVKPCAVRSLAKRGLLPVVRDWAGHRRFREDVVGELRDKLLRGEIAQTTGRLERKSPPPGNNTPDRRPTSKRAKERNKRMQANPPRSEPSQLTPSRAAPILESIEGDLSRPQIVYPATGGSEERDESRREEILKSWKTR